MQIVAVLWGFTVALFTSLSFLKWKVYERERKRERENLLVEGAYRLRGRSFSRALKEHHRFKVERDRNKMLVSEL